MGKSSLKKSVSAVVTLKDTEESVEVEVEAPKDVMYLFTTKTCPNCKLAKEYLKNENYVLIDAEENMELAQKYSVMQAPTLVVIDDNSFKKYVNASNIKKFAEAKGVLQV